MTQHKKHHGFRFILISLFAVLCAQVFSGQASAAVKNDAQVEAAAQAQCGDDTPTNQAACQEGYKKGYGRNTDATKNEACNGFSNALSGSGPNAQSPRAACKRGYDKGKAARTADNPPSPGGSGSASPVGGNDCGPVKTFFNLSDICAGTDNKASDEKSPIIAIALGIVNIMAFGVSLVVAGGIVYGGILYASARDNSSQTQKAMTIIVDSVTGLVAFFFMWAIINFIVPGGLF